MDTENRFEKVRAAIRQLDSGIHACTLYDRREKEVAMAVSYIQAGLERGALCVCVVDDGGQNIREGVASEGIDVDAELRAGRLIVLHQYATKFRTDDLVRHIHACAMP